MNTITLKAPHRGEFTVDACQIGGGQTFVGICERCEGMSWLESHANLNWIGLKCPCSEVLCEIVEPLVD